jgi:hypothetical protein
MVTHTRSRSRREVHDNHDVHTHSAIDLLILTTDRGIWALKWYPLADPIVGLLITTAPPNRLGIWGGCFHPPA